MELDKNNLVGSWKLLSFQLKYKNSEKFVCPYGLKPIGTLLFCEDGLMSVSIMANNRNNFSNESIQMASVEEKIQAIGSYLSYSGRWRIEDNKIFVNVLVSLIPNWVNKEHFRYFTLEKNNLTFITPQIYQTNEEVYIELIWTKF